MMRRYGQKCPFCSFDLWCGEGDGVCNGFLTGLLTVREVAGQVRNDESD